MMSNERTMQQEICDLKAEIERLKNCECDRCEFYQFDVKRQKAEIERLKNCKCERCEFYQFECEQLKTKIGYLNEENKALRKKMDHLLFHREKEGKSVKDLFVWMKGQKNIKPSVITIRNAIGKDQRKVNEAFFDDIYCPWAYENAMAACKASLRTGNFKMLTMLWKKGIGPSDSLKVQEKKVMKWLQKGWITDADFLHFLKSHWSGDEVFDSIMNSRRPITKSILNEILEWSFFDDDLAKLLKNRYAPVKLIMEALDYVLLEEREDSPETFNEKAREVMMGVFRHAMEYERSKVLQALFWRFNAIMPVAGERLPFWNQSSIVNPRVMDRGFKKVLRDFDFLYRISPLDIHTFRHIISYLYFCEYTI